MDALDLSDAVRVCHDHRLERVRNLRGALPWGEEGVRVYQVAYMFFAYLGAVLSMELVWGISDLLNSLMALPNLFCLWMLRGEIATDCGKGTDKTSKKK